MNNEITKRLLRIKDLEILLGVSKSTIWRWRQQPHIGFPEPICLGPRLVGWVISDIEAWLDKNKLRGNAA
jgi:prophage regulatory protein